MKVFLGIDYGHKRIGLAVADEEIGVATPIAPILLDKVDSPFSGILKVIKERRISDIVVGMPYNKEGQIGHKGEEVLHFIENLKKHTNLPISTMDEQLTSYKVEADMMVFGMQKKFSKKNLKAIQAQRKSGDVDSRSAALILQDFIDKNSS